MTKPKNSERHAIKKNIEIILEDLKSIKENLLEHLGGMHHVFREEIEAIEKKIKTIEGHGHSVSSTPVRVSRRFETPGDRIKFLRELCGKTRKEFSEQYAIPEISQRQIELNKYLLSSKKLEQYLQIFTQENVHIAKEWILHGVVNDSEKETNEIIVAVSE